MLHCLLIYRGQHSHLMSTQRDLRAFSQDNQLPMDNLVLDTLLTITNLFARNDTGRYYNMQKLFTFCLIPNTFK